MWKKASVVPIPKKSVCSDPSDYRPISILCFLSKVLEKLIFEQIMQHLEKNNLISTWQSGFRRFHSCESALLKVTSDIRLKVDQGSAVVLCLLDFSKAFDSVSHPLLLQKLSSNFIFSKFSVKLIEDFLSNRKQHVKIDGLFSKDLNVFRGVPQGSLLGPLLFSLFINDLPNKITNCYIHMYADDVQLYYSENPAKLAFGIDVINENLMLVWSWAEENGLNLNPLKSQYMVISRISIAVNSLPPVLLNRQPLPLVHKVKNLGVWINDNMTCCDYISDILRKVYGGLRSLKLTAGLLPSDIRMKLIQSLIIPHFTYGSVIFPSLDSECARKLDVAFNDCLRFIYNLPRFSHISHLRNNVLGYLRHRSLVFLHKVVYTGNPAY